MFKRILVGLLAAASCLNANSLMQDEIEHVVILMMENRSFDNVLAWLYEEDAPLTLIPETISPPFIGLSEETLDDYTNYLLNSAGEIIYGCNPIKGVPSVANSNLLNSPRFDPNEPFTNVMNQIFGTAAGGPLMRGFLQDYATLWSEDEWVPLKDEICAVMETYTKKELPVLYSLAKHYAICDYWFASVPTQTNPNRAFLMCGTSDGQIVNGSFLVSTFETDTIWNRLYDVDPSTTWKVFWQADYFPVLYPGPYSGIYSFSALSRIPHWDQHFHTIDHFHELARSGTLPMFSFLEPQWTLSLNISSKSRKITQDVFLGVQGNDFHPPADVRASENFLANVYTSLIANKEAWNKTLLVILFDEHGGLFDHVPPPKAVPPDTNFQNGFIFDMYGVRVPALFISPHIAKSAVMRAEGDLPFDHTSIMATIFKWRDIDKSLWNMGSRTQVAPTFESVVTLNKPREDIIVGLSSNEAAALDQSQSLIMNTPFYLKDNANNYVVAGKLFHNIAHFGDASEKITLRFTGGEGAVTHGSFVLIQVDDPELGTKNILKCAQWGADHCTYDSKQHHSQQWWTIKSVDHPIVGYPISYGDRIYLENHVYLDVLQYAPGRLASVSLMFGDFLTTKPVYEENSSEFFWTIEKP